MLGTSLNPLLVPTDAHKFPNSKSLPNSVIVIISELIFSNKIIKKKIPNQLYIPLPTEIIVPDADKEKGK